MSLGDGGSGDSSLAEGAGTCVSSMFRTDIKGDFLLISAFLVTSKRPLLLTAAVTPVQKVLLVESWWIGGSARVTLNFLFKLAAGCGGSGGVSPWLCSGFEGWWGLLSRIDTL